MAGAEQSIFQRAEAVAIMNNLPWLRDAAMATRSLREHSEQAGN